MLPQGHAAPLHLHLSRAVQLFLLACSVGRLPCQARRDGLVVIVFYLQTKLFFFFANFLFVEDPTGFFGFPISTPLPPILPECCARLHFSHCPHLVCFLLRVSADPVTRNPFRLFSLIRAPPSQTFKLDQFTGRSPLLFF